MSDEHLRELERRWEESGESTDKAAWLRERVRLGQLSTESLNWAASCDDEASMAASDKRLDLPTLAEALPPGEACARFWLAIVRAGWRVLGDDRFLAHLWIRERLVMGLDNPSMFELGYATLASDVLMASDDHLQRACSLIAGHDPGPPLPDHLHRDPGPALEALSEHVAFGLMKAQLRTDWVPWLLGEGDPVQARVAANPDPPQVEGVSWNSLEAL